ncbi:MAG: hypothetical protein CO030_04040 [Candidatus Magasanikbacteria bacterium CG_4_9_14_0_2_um_filter_42_11]|uniref:DUF5652 domain-containing protein n=1 Tax=Candidatus Magasanikbacteria bacterium CG_4_9_14_0_2_um_filter_42_11 TaxID=1974643 RepID=A0A2M8F962_9BACT|nr:MAG: hypothetical protein COU34_04255 [Candidatus Magasanikbacteria bacterium CG10_big_fil_rev_8_21_14_0_10_43_9]PIY92235.1 MAG: hypothetical protein COY70_04260 [Candidatus Magasanikbacteria bacterium CG_4_10_14_0_8_um_filter_42_12]PJC52262.1 MAG: hypothetical protein CO030_04040 [Candidatus Magasanikbacteria bacterium CG_4_9_14_0_2_um_filter_42_11]
MWDANTHNYMMGTGGFGFGFAQGFWGFMPLVLVWSFVWKALALWKAARRGDTIWFGALLVLNTVGIAEILYLFVFSEPKGILKDKTNTVSGGEVKKEEQSNPQV